MPALELVFLRSSYAAWRWRSLRPSQGLSYPFRPIADPAARARARERRRKMFALTKAAFPDLRVPTPFVSVRANETSPFPMPFVRASLVIKPYDEDDDSCTDIFDT
jgi:hypothetical protein